jgi:phage terminase large subunit-like protein
LITQSPSCGVVLFSQHPPARIVGDAVLSCGVVLFSQHPPARIVVDADLSCGVVLFSQHLPARIVVHADLSCEAPFYTRWARGSDSRGHGSSQARRQERDTMIYQSVRTKCEDGSPENFGLGIRPLL